MAPWFSFWHVLYSGEWVANVGLPMLLSLIALLVAYRFFRGQIANDQVLMKEQGKLDREQTNRERRRDALSRFSDYVHETQRRRWEGRPEWPIDLENLRHEISRTRAVTGDQRLYAQAESVGNDVNVRARVFARTISSFGSLGGKALDGIYLDFVASRSSRYRTLAEACFKWDGDSPLEAKLPDVPYQAHVEPRYWDAYEENLYNELYETFCAADMSWVAPLLIRYPDLRKMGGGRPWVEPPVSSSETAGAKTAQGEQSSAAQGAEEAPTDDSQIFMLTGRSQGARPWPQELKIRSRT